MSGAILCGIDGSPKSQDALRVAQQYASLLGARLILAYSVEDTHAAYAAVDPTVGGFGAAPLVLAETERKKGRRRRPDCCLNRWPSTLRSNTPTVGWPSATRPSGWPTWPTTRAPRLIVVGSRGQGAFRAAFLGSVSSTLVGVARCPILIVLPGAD
jgi:nucleotide-binding universal stress UspA family protein